MDPEFNPFAVLSLIVAPAVLTNAASVLAMSTSTRLGRAVDRGRELSKQLETSKDLSSARAARRLRELTVVEARTLMLVSALRSEYIALGGFATATLVSLLGAVMVPLGLTRGVRALEMAAVVAGLIAVSALVHGSMVLVRETRAVVQLLQERAADLHARADRFPAPTSEQTPT